MINPASSVMDRLGRVAFWLSIALLLGRVLGFARELFLARLLGVSLQSDQAVILLALPDMFVNILLAGGLGGALIPALSQSNDEGRVQQVLQFLVLVCLLFIPLSLWVALFPEAVISLLAPGASFPFSFHAQVQWVAVAVMLSALTGVFSAWLNSENRFFIAGSGGLIFNAVVLISLVVFWWLKNGSILNYITAGIVVACVLRLAITAMPLWRKIIHAWPFALRLPEYELLRKFLFALGAVGFVQVLPVFIRAFATQIEPGALAAFNYAHKLIELPVGVALASIGVVILPVLSGKHFNQDHNGFRQLLFSALFKSILLSLILLLASLLLLPWAVELLFGGGAMTTKGLQNTLELALLIAWTLPLVGISNVVASALNAMSRQGVLVICAMLSLLMTAVYLDTNLQLGAYNVLGSSMIVFYASFSFTISAALYWVRRSL